MKAPAFDYIRAASVAEAISLLGDHGGDAKLIAGGQSLLAALNLRLFSPSILIDIAGIEELRGISLEKDHLRIGALTRHVDLLESPLVARHAPLLHDAIAHVAHAAIRNRGTFGGSIANADPAAELPACSVALQARMVIEGPAGRRSVAADDFFHDLYETALASDEILTEVLVPVIAPQQRSGFIEFARRKGDYALVGLAAMVEREKTGHFTLLRLIYFSVGGRPVIAGKAAAALVGPWNDARLDQAVDALAEDLDPPDDTQASAAYRLHLAGVLLRRLVGQWRGDAA